MSDQKLYPVKQEFSDSAWINNEKYLQMYQQSIINPEGFWREQAMQRIDWMKPFTRVRNVSFDDHNVDIKWFEDGTLNTSVNCLDRHRSEEHTSELQSRENLVCRLLLEK